VYGTVAILASRSWYCTEVNWVVSTGETILGAGVALVHDPGDLVTSAGAGPQRHLQGVQGQLGGHAGRGAPLHDAARVDVADETDVLVVAGTGLDHRAWSPMAWSDQWGCSFGRQVELFGACAAAVLDGGRQTGDARLCSDARHCQRVLLTSSMFVLRRLISQYEAIRWIVGETRPEGCRSLS